MITVTKTGRINWPGAKVIAMFLCLHWHTQMNVHVSIVLEYLCGVYSLHIVCGNHDN